MLCVFCVFSVCGLVCCMCDGVLHVLCESICGLGYVVCLCFVLSVYVG